LTTELVSLPALYLLLYCRLSSTSRGVFSYMITCLTRVSKAVIQNIKSKQSKHAALTGLETRTNLAYCTMYTAQTRTVLLL